jgi:hypothetical protein
VRTGDYSDTHVAVFIKAARGAGSEAGDPLRALFETQLKMAEAEYAGARSSQALVRNLALHAGSRFAHRAAPGRHPVHDTQIKRYRHLNF